MYMEKNCVHIIETSVNMDESSVYMDESSVYTNESRVIWIRAACKLMRATVGCIWIRRVFTIVNKLMRDLCICMKAVWCIRMRSVC